MIVSGVVEHLARREDPLLHFFFRQASTARDDGSSSDEERVAGGRESFGSRRKSMGEDDGEDLGGTTYASSPQEKLAKLFDAYLRVKLQNGEFSHRVGMAVETLYS